MKNHIRLRAALLIVILLLSAIVLFILTYPRFLNKHTCYTAFIYQNGILLESIDLAAVQENITLVIGDPEGDHNTISIIPGCIAIINASCPDQICVHQGYISTPLMPITCLPNHLVIELKVQSSPDAVTY